MTEITQERRIAAGAFDLSGRRVLITGASRGIGRALAVGLAGHGATVFCVARSEDGLRETREAVAAAGGSAETLSADLRGAEGQQRAVDEMARRLGGIDILINNAADDHDSSIEDTDEALWRRVVDLNLTSAASLCRAAGEHLKADGGGKVINMVSVLADVGVRNNSAYVASKHGLLGFTRALALEWARQGVQVNALGPGFIKTEMTRHVWEDERANAWIMKRTPIGRWGSADDLVGAAVFLSSSASDYVTGQALYVDGGWLAQ
jgi:NAD(P)-dependent dehydrogenase (short-subunit alcohol dehydrogenase family)